MVLVFLPGGRDIAGKTVDVIRPFVGDFLFQLRKLSISSTELSFVATVERKVADVLEAVELQKEDFGLSNVDFSVLSLGKEIPPYELTESGLVRMDDVHYFPILCDDSWVATAVVSYSVYGDMNIEVSAKYADDYSVLREADVSRKSNSVSGVALVFDSTKAYLYSENGSILVESFQEISGRESIETSHGLINPTTVQVIAQNPINVTQLTPTRDSENFVSLNISSITQPTNYTCWAASTAMLLNYRGESETVSSVASAAGVNLYTYRSAAQCAALISDPIDGYGYPCGTWGASYGYYYSLTLDNLVTELYTLSSPLFAGFSSGSVGHAVVVKGYVNLSGSPTMTYIDPADGYIKATSVPSNGAVTITYGGSSHGLAAAFAVYEPYDY